MIDPFCRDPGEIDVQAPQPNAVARLHGHQRTGSISVPPPMGPKWKGCRNGPQERGLTVAKATQDALDDPGRANDLETNRSQGNQAGNHNHRLLKVRVWTFEAEGAGQDQDER
jgi:hypothetical protein